MFQQKLNEVGAPVVTCPEVRSWPDGRPPPSSLSVTSEMFSSGCSGVKGRLVFHRSPNAHNPPDGSAHRWISYSVRGALRGGGRTKTERETIAEVD